MSFNAGEVTASLRIDRSEFQRGLSEAKSEGDKFSRSDFTAKLSVADRDAQARIAQFQAKMERLKATIERPVELSLQARKAYAELDKLNAQLADLSKKPRSAKVDADTIAAKAKIAELNVKLTEIERRDVEVKVKASADLLKTRAELDLLLLKMREVQAAADTFGRRFADSMNIGGRWGSLRSARCCSAFRL